MNMSNFEVSPLRSYLPELAPAEAFSHSFYSTVAHTYWQDPSLVALKDAVPLAVETLAPREVMQASAILDKLDDTYNANPHAVFDLWINKTVSPTECHEADVAEAGVKTLTRIRKLLASEYASGVARNLYEVELHAAAQVSGIGCSTSAELRGRLRQERDRRRS
jgi:hypothetical protein